MHCLLVSCKHINHKCFTLVIWSTLQLTTKQWIITQQFSARADLFLEYNLNTKQLFTYFVSYRWPLGQLVSFKRCRAQSKAYLLGMQVAPSSIPMSGTFFLGDLVVKKFLRPFSLFRWFKKSSCQLLAKECALNTGKLPRLAREQCG